MLWFAGFCLAFSSQLCNGPLCVGADGSLQLKGVWPYWLPRPQPSTTTQHTDAQQMHNNFDEGLQESHLEDRAAAATGEVGMREVVANDLELAQRLMLLTGANMSGKSTLMRAIMASALLGSVGLPVPCIDAIIPEVCWYIYIYIYPQPACTHSVLTETGKLL